MSARPYDIAAYSPATKSAEISVARVSSRLASRYGQHGLAGLLGVRVDDHRLPVGEVLRDDERRVDLAVGFELDVAARQDGVANVDRPQRLHDLVLVEGTRLRERDEERAGRLVGERRVPFGVELGVRLGSLVVERLDRGVRDRLIPPRRGDDVVGALPERVAALLVRAARTVRDVRVVHPGLGVLALHRDVVVEVRVRHERVGVRRLHLLEQRREVFSVQVERFGQHDLVVRRLLLRARGETDREVAAVRGVLVHDRHAQRLGQLLLRLHLLDEVALGIGEAFDRGQQAEDRLETALVDRRRGAAAADVRDAVLVRNDRLRLHEIGRIAAQHRVDVVLHRQPLVQVARGRGIGLVVVDDQLDGDLAAVRPELHAAVVVDLFGRELVPRLVVRADRALFARQGEDGPDHDLRGPVIGLRRDRDGRGDEGAGNRCRCKGKEGTLHARSSGHGGCLGLIPRGGRRTCHGVTANRRAMGGKTTIVHAADVHLETAFTELRGGARRRAALADAFVRIVDLALARRADALTIGGDLYEAERAGPQTARFVFAQLARFGGPVFVAPGNHDPYSARALYARDDRPANLHVFAEPVWAPYPLADGVTIYGFGHAPAEPGRPFANARFERPGVRIALVHGSDEDRCPPGKRATAPFTLAEILASARPVCWPVTITAARSCGMRRACRGSPIRDRRSRSSSANAARTVRSS